ncbi:MAG: spore germination protein [Clostridia bacterium]|nr:spore germination protein [Clostridia bacterium]
MIKPKKVRSRTMEKKTENNSINTAKEISLEDVRLEVQVMEEAPSDDQQYTRGPKERFSGNLNLNLTRLGERFKGAELKLEQFEVGSIAPKKVVLAYLKERANPEIVREIRQRISAIRAVTLLDISFVERNIEDSPLSPFPQAEVCQRPDGAEAALFQGRTVILCEGSPQALLAPATFFDLLDTPEDVYSRWFLAASFFRIARFIMFIFAVSLPGFYIALTSFNTGFIPTHLAFLIAGSREGTPFPVYFEAFLIMGVVEAVRMMMVRLPTQLGATIALFSGLALIGTGIVAKIISIPMVIIATLTMISSFAIANNDLREAVRLLQFFTMLMTSIFGLFGFAIAFIYIAIHMSVLKSFGIAYMSPLAPLEGSGLGHTIVRENTEMMAQDETYKPITVE